MRRLAVGLPKGGVGKTTTAVNLADGLARAGKLVLLIDTDTQNQVAKSLGCQPRAGLSELVSGEAGLEQAVHPVRPGLYLLSGGPGLTGLKMLISKKEFGGEQTLNEALEPLDKIYDYVLIDTSPGWDILTVNVLFYARELLAPVSMEVLTLQSLKDYGRSLAAVQKYRPELSLRYILPTFYDRRVRKSAEILEQLQHAYGPQVCDPIRYNVKLSEAPGHGQTIFDYASASPGAEDYQKLTERVVNDG